MENDLFLKNRDRNSPEFANINLLGRCNANCYFCLGKDLGDLISNRNDTVIHFSQWKNWEMFIAGLKKIGVKKVYVTGQNVDSLQYKYLDELIEFLHSNGFGVGLRTNGLLALKRMDTINKCDLSVGYSIHTLKKERLGPIMGWKNPLDWDSILSQTRSPRIAMVVTRHNVDEVLDIIKFASKHKSVKYFQARRVSTDFRQEELKNDLVVYEDLHRNVEMKFPLVRTFHGAPIYDIHGMECVFWRTIQTNIGSWNYFTDGTVSDMYFVIEGYMKNREE